VQPAAVRMLRGGGLSGFWIQVEDDGGNGRDLVAERGGQWFCRRWQPPPS
jgi:hypothetical protein